MKLNSVWLILSVVIIICGSGIRSEAYMITVEKGIRQATGGGSGQTGKGGGASSCGGASRTGATGRDFPRIPKLAEDQRGQGKNKKRKSENRKNKRKNCKGKRGRK